MGGLVNSLLTVVMAIGRASAGDIWASPYEAEERGFLFVRFGLLDRLFKDLHAFEGIDAKNVCRDDKSDQN